MKLKTSKALTLLTSIVLGFSTIQPMMAQEIEDPTDISYDENGILHIDNQEALLDLVERARQVGVQVNVSEQVEDPIHVAEAGDQAQHIVEYNAQQMEQLEASIQRQDENNQNYLHALEESFQPMIGQEWTVEELENLLLTEQERNLEGVARLRRMMEVMSDVSVVSPSSEQTSLIERNVATEGYLTVGDTLVYGNVFVNSKTGRWVDLKLELVGVNPVFNQSSERVALRQTGISPNKPWVHYTADDTVFHVTFLDHETKEPVLVKPIITFTDVDNMQAVKINNQNLVNNVLYGSRVSPITNEIYDHAYIGGEQSANVRDRQNWVIYSLKETTDFTYTFYAQRHKNLTVLQGIGMTDFIYNKTNVELKTESIDIVLKKQPIYHQVKYQYVGSTPADVNPFTDDTQYLLNQELSVAPDPVTQEQEKDGKPGVWTFRGWYLDEELTIEATNHAVVKDEILYGAWDFKPSPVKIIKVKRQSPQTGYGNLTAAYLGVGMIALISMALMAVARKKNKTS